MGMTCKVRHTPDLYKQFNIHALYTCRNKLSLCYILGSQMLKIRFKWFINYSMAVVLITYFLPYRNQCTTIPCRHVLYPMFISCPVRRFTYNLFVCVLISSTQNQRRIDIRALCVLIRCVTYWDTYLYHLERHISLSYNIHLSIGKTPHNVKQSSK